MEISNDEVRRIAGLANLELDDAEVERLAREIGDILGHFQRLRQVETRDVAPYLGPGGGKPSLRPDQPAPGLSREDALAAAPEARSGHFRVPRVIG